MKFIRLRGEIVDTKDLKSLPLRVPSLAEGTTRSELEIKKTISFHQKGS